MSEYVKTFRVKDGDKDKNKNLIHFYKDDESFKTISNKIEKYFTSL